MNTSAQGSPFLFNQILGRPKRIQELNILYETAWASPPASNLDLAGRLCATKINKLASRSAGLTAVVAFAGMSSKWSTYAEQSGLGGGVFLLPVVQTGNATEKINKRMVVVRSCLASAWAEPPAL